MGKPKARKSGRKVAEGGSLHVKERVNKGEELMEDANEKECEDKIVGTKIKTVLEDIRINNVEKSKVMKKKDKRKQKRSTLLTKLQNSKSLKDEAKQAKGRSKTVIIGDVKPMMDALPEIPNPEETEKLLEKSTSRSQNKNWNDKKWRTKRKEELQDISLFQKVLQLPEYKSDPVGAISNHVEYLIKGDLI